MIFFVVILSDFAHCFVFFSSKCAFRCAFLSCIFAHFCASFPYPGWHILPCKLTNCQFIKFELSIGFCRETILGLLNLRYSIATHPHRIFSTSFLCIILQNLNTWHSRNAGTLTDPFRGAVAARRLADVSERVVLEPQLMGLCLHFGRGGGEPLQALTVGACLSPSLHRSFIIDHRSYVVIRIVICDAHSTFVHATCIFPSAQHNQKPD